MTVALVGAGPGDPGLLTVRGAELLRRAQVVVHDRLSAAELLDLAPPDAERIDVGKSPDGPSVPQERINELLVEHGRAGRRVVRLKGGDPFVFGRGGEEVEVLARAGIACEVVPGISSALAGPASVGIPVTHRQVARAVTIVTGHEATDSDPVDWSAVARLGGTLVVLMGVERREAIVSKMIESGLDADTPAAVVMHATTPRQRVWSGTAAELPGADIASPAVMVIGAVATFADDAAALVAAHTLPLDG